MYIVVRERTREIGIRRAVGATRRDILIQFFVETCLIVGMGAFFGMLLSIGLVKATAELPIQDAVGSPVISPLVMVITLVRLAVVAFVAVCSRRGRRHGSIPSKRCGPEAMLRIPLEEFPGDLQGPAHSCPPDLLAVAWERSPLSSCSRSARAQRSLRDGLSGRASGSS
jgi:hypothetical protein